MATLASIRALARIRADHTNSSFPTDAAYNTLINTAARRVWRKLIRAGWQPSLDTTTITADGSGSYPLPPNVSQIVEVYRVDGGTFTPLPRLKPEDRGTYLSMGAGPALTYELHAGAIDPMEIIFYPRPSSGSYNVRFIERFSDFEDDADPWIGPEGSDELIAIQAAIMALDAEGVTDTRKLDEEYKEMYVEICEDAGWTDQKHPGTVRDVTNHHTRDPFDFDAREGWY